MLVWGIHSMGLLETLATTLEEANLATRGTDLFLGLLPDAPDAALALFETAGQPPSYIHNQLWPALDRPGVQLCCRDDDYAQGRDRMQAAYEALCDSTSYVAIQPIQPPFALARDERHRPRWAVNFVVTQLGG
jgi:hypothetical protein